MTAKNVLPFMGVDFDQFVTFKGRKFRVLTYQAYNAMGLIGPERNGVAVIDHDNRCVLLDQHARQNSGYYGTSTHQLNEAKRICALSQEDFLSFVNNHPTCRQQVSVQ